MIELQSETLDLGTFVNALMRSPNHNSLVAITAVSNAKRQLATVLIRKPSAFLSLQYLDFDRHSATATLNSNPVPLEQTIDGIQQYVARHRLEGSFDLVVADPYHSYQSSLECLQLCLSLVKPGGFIVVHDCLPPFDLMSTTFRPGQWCGVTFAAFRDLCNSCSVSWFTVDADFGLGVMYVHPAAIIDPIAPQSSSILGEDALAEYVNKYQNDPFSLMRAVAPKNAGEALNRIVRQEPIDDLLELFTGTGPRNPRPPSGT